MLYRTITLIRLLWWHCLPFQNKVWRYIYSHPLVNYLNFLNATHSVEVSYVFILHSVSFFKLNKLLTFVSNSCQSSLLPIFMALTLLLPSFNGLQYVPSLLSHLLSYFWQPTINDSVDCWLLDQLPQVRRPQCRRIQQLPLASIRRKLPQLDYHQPQLAWILPSRRCLLLLLWQVDRIFLPPRLRIERFRSSDSDNRGLVLSTKTWWVVVRTYQWNNLKVKTCDIPENSTYCTYIHCYLSLKQLLFAPTDRSFCLQTYSDRDY